MRRATFSLPNDPDRAYQEHRAIIDAVARRDEEGAREAMRLHLQNAVSDWNKLGDVRIGAT